MCAPTINGLGTKKIGDKLSQQKVGGGGRFSQQQMGGYIISNVPNKKQVSTMGGIHPFEEQRRHVELLKFRSIFCSTTLAFLGGKLRKESAWNKGITDTVHCCWFRNPERSS